MDNQQPSTSSSSSSGQQKEMDKIEHQQKQKKLKEEPKSETESQVEVEEENQPFIDELPPEMLMKILEYLDTKNLFISRLVSRRWNGIVYGIIQTRNDVEILFYCLETEEGNLTIAGKSEGSSLENFIQCFVDSKESPLYFRFVFEDFEPSVFDNLDWIKFISDFGKSIKCLKLEAADSDSVDEAMPWAEKLKNLLVNQAPNLQEFGLHLPYNPLFINNDASKRVQLFPTPTPTTTSNESEETTPASTSNVETTAATTVQLPHLKVLYLDDIVFSNFTGIVTDLLNASVHLQKIELAEQEESEESCMESLCLLQSLGKLHCLETAFINFDAEVLSKFQETPSFPPAFKLKKLSWFFKHSIYEDRDFWPHAALFITHVFESSKDTLEDLTMEPLGFLTALKLPKFSKLTRLGVQEAAIEPEEVEENLSFQVLPSRLDVNEIFPLLQHLDADVPLPNFFPRDENPSQNQGQNVSCLPNIKTLKIRSSGMTKEGVAWISQACPNLEGLDMYHLKYEGTTGNFPEVATAIWTHFTKLETLDLNIGLSSTTDAFPALDSCFTGFSGEYISRLYDLIQAQELLNNSEWGFPLEISKSELEAERRNPSILDLKDLKNLRIQFWTLIPRVEINPDLSRKILQVSEKYAFQLMENLTFKTDKAF